jgi:hypothetical protein
MHKGMYTSAMSGLKIIIQGVSAGEVKPIEATIFSILGDADPSWSITLIAQQDGVWRLFGQAADSPSFRIDLADDQHSPEAIWEIVFGWYEQYKEARLQRAMIYTITEEEHSDKARTQ